MAHIERIRPTVVTRYTVTLSCGHSHECPEGQPPFIGKHIECKVCQLIEEKIRVIEIRAKRTGQGSTTGGNLAVAIP
jgi:hypothetical protein